MRLGREGSCYEFVKRQVLHLTGSNGDGIGSVKTSILFIAGCVVVGFIGFIDWITAQKVSLYVFYSVPIFFGAWFVRPFGGFFFCFLSVFTWMAVDLRLHPSDFPLVLWNGVLRLSFFIAISTVISSLKGTLDREKAWAGLDYLTQLPNRRTFLSLAERERQRARRYRRHITLAYIDLDDFKEINDRSGHDVGDLLLKEVADELRRRIRISDIVARIGGDEFVILFPETGYEAAESILIKLKDSVNKRMQARNWSISLSIGAITYTDNFPEIKEMIGTADLLMYTAKAAGKNTIRHETIDLPNCLPVVEV